MALLEDLFGTGAGPMASPASPAKAGLLMDFLNLLGGGPAPAAGVKPFQPVMAQKRPVAPRAAPGPAPDGGKAPAPAPAPAPMKRPDYAPSFSERASAFGRALQGQDVGNLDRVAESKNMTFDFLVRRGMAPEDAQALIGNPTMLQSALPSILGSGKAATDVEEIYDESGRKQKVLLDKVTGKYTPIGGAYDDRKPDPVDILIKRDELARGREQEKADTKRLLGIQAESDGARDLISKVDQLRAAREGVSYEGGVAPEMRTWLGRNLPDSPIPGIGLPFVPSQEEAGKAEQIKALATDLQLGFTQKTKGAISNREMDLFGQATPGMFMSDKGAKAVMDGVEAGSIRAREKGKFYAAYRAKNGSLDGADESWDQFVESSPVLEPDGAGGFKVNKANATAWRRFIDGGATPQASGAGASSTAAPGSALDRARDAIARGADRNKVIERLQANGIDTTGL